MGGVFPEERMREREIWRSLVFLVRVLSVCFSKRVRACVLKSDLCLRRLGCRMRVRRRRTTSRNWVAVYRRTAFSRTRARRRRTT